MPKSKREEFARFEQELKKLQKKKPEAKQAPKEETKPVVKEEPKPQEQPKETPKNIDQLVEDAVKEIKTEETKDKDLASLYIEATGGKKEDAINTSRYPTSPFSDTAVGDVYGKAGKGTGGYAALATTNPYKTTSGDAYGSANDAYGTNAYGKTDNAYKPISSTPDFDKIENNLSGLVKLTPARKAHEAHLSGNADPSCSYCKKAF